MRFMDDLTTDMVVAGREVAEFADMASYSVILGNRAGQYVNDGYNVIIGHEAGLNFDNTDQVMKDNVIVGYQAGYDNDGNRNVYIGKQAGANNHGDGNIFIGNNSGSLPTAVSNQLRIANQNTNVQEPLIFGEFDNSKVGINDVTPSASLHIKQIGGGEEGLAIENDGDTDVWAFEIGGNDFNLSYNGVAKGYFEETDGSYNLASDRRLKNSIKSIPDGTLTKLIQLDPKTYFYNDDELRTELSYGFIAQEVQKVFPGVVGKFDDGSDYLSLNYTKLGVVAIKAIQEQQEIIDSMQNQLDTCMKMISSLEKELASVQSQIADTTNK